MGLAEGMVDYLDTNGVYTNSMFVSEMPHEPDRCLAVKESGGGQPYHTMGADTNSVIWEPDMQVVTRASRYVDAQQDVMDVAAEFDGLTDYELDGIRVLFTSLHAMPVHIGDDEQGRRMFSANFRFMCEPVF